MPAFEYGTRATRGQRGYQEDAAALWPGRSTFDLKLRLPDAPDGVLVAVLADGMGGHAGGALASQIGCRSFIAALSGLSDTGVIGRQRPVRTIPLDEEGIASPSEEPVTVAGIGEGPDLLTALNAANSDIALQSATNPALSGMGTTLIGAVFREAGLEWISVGDSPLYLVRRGEIALLNEDHSLAPALDLLAKSGEITEEEARNDPRRHMLRSALTGEELDLIDVSRKPLVLQPGDHVILASDGIHTIDGDEIARIVTAYEQDGTEAIAEALIRAVENQRMPHQDNCTVVVVKAT